MKWIGEHIWDLTSRFRNTISIGKDSSILTNIDQSTNDISTWQLQPEHFYVNPQESTPEAIFFKPDGTKMYILGRSGDDVGEYALSTAWDVSTASYTDALSGLGSSPTSESNPYGMYISPDGIYLYIVGHSQDQVIQYTMSAAWDISTASYTREQGLTDAGGTFADPTGIHFKPDGTMFWSCSYNEDTIQQYTLSTPWDVSTLSVGDSFSLRDFFILNDFSDDGAVADIGSSEDLFFSEDGTKVWLVESGYDSAHQLKLSTAWDIRTAAYDGKGIRHSAFESVVEGIYVNETAGKAFTVSSSSDRVRSFNIGGTVFSSANNASVGFEGGIGVKGDASFSGATSFVDITTQSAYVYGGFTTYSTTNLTHINGGTVNILDGTVYTGDATLDVMTNVYYGANSADLSAQDTYIHNMNLGRPRGGAKVTLNIGRRVGSGGGILNHTGIMDVVSMAQTFDHYGSLDVGRTLQVDGKADLELFDLGGTVVFNDTFTESSTTAIESHTPDLGVGWTKVFDTGSTTTFNIIGGGGYGQLSNTESSDGVMFLADTTPTGVDYEVRVDFKRRDNGDDVFLIIIKYQDANNYYALQWSASYSSYCKLFRVEGGSVVNVESNFNYGAMNSTADNLSTALKLRFIDNTLMVWDIDSNDYKSFRGSYPVTTDFNDGNGGTYHKVGMAFGDLFGGSLDATATWKIDKFEVKMLSSAATFAAATKSYVDAGNFGVGITNPTSKFHVVGDARIQGNLTVNGTYTQIDTDVNTTEQWLVTNDGTGPAAVINQLGTEDIFDVQDDGTSVFYIEDGGQIGIGTTSPGHKLDVDGGAQFNTNTGATPFYVTRLGATDQALSIKVMDDNVRFESIQDETADNYGGFDFRMDGGVTEPDFVIRKNAGNPILNVKGNGNVGIGTSSPNSSVKLQVEETGSNAYIRIVETGNTGLDVGQEINGNGIINLRDNKDLRLFTNGTEAVRIKNTGNVGIGTTSPGTKLHVGIGSGATVDTAYQIVADGSAISGIQILSGATQSGRLVFGDSSNNDIGIIKYDHSDNSLQTIVNAAERMRIDSSGNVGIGTTSPDFELDVAGNIGMDNKLYHNGDHNTYIGFEHDDIKLRTGGVDAITVNSSQNIGIGTTSPSEKLDVNGNIAVSGSVQKQISTTHHTFTFGAAGSASQDYWIPFIGNSELAAPNVTHRTIAPYTGILKKAIVHSTIAYGTSAQVRFHRIDNGTASVFVNDNSTDDVTTNVTADMSTAYSSVAFDFTTDNTFSAGDQIGVSFVRNNTGLGDVAITLVWEYELF
jgi:hypothetical protein